MVVDYILSQWYMKVGNYKIVNFLEHKNLLHWKFLLFDKEIKIILIKFVGDLMLEMKLKSIAWELDQNVLIGLKTSKHSLSGEIKFHNAHYDFLAT